MSGFDFWCVGFVCHLQGSLEQNEVRCQRRTRLLDCSIGGALRAGLYECPREPQLTFFLVAVMADSWADLVARCQVSGNQKIVRNLHVSFFVFTLRSLKVSSQIIVEFAPL